MAREDVAGVDQGPVEGGVSQVIPASASPAASAPEPRSSILSDLMGVLGRGRGGGASRAEAARAERAGVAAESAFMSSPRPAPKEKAKLKFMRKSKGKRGTGKRQVLSRSSRL